MRTRGFAFVALAGLCLACDRSDSTLSGPCPGSQTCGFIDHKFFSTFYCPVNPPFPGGAIGYSWRELNHCVEECSVAADWGCDVSGCESGCQVDHGSGAWLPCTEANRAEERIDGCFLSGSGVTGETIPCVCR